MRDLKNNIEFDQSLPPESAPVTTSANGASSDLSGGYSAAVAFNIGPWGDGTHTFSVEESDDDSTFTAVAAADLQGTAPVVNDATDDNQVYVVGYIGNKRYIRAVCTVTGGPVTGLVRDANVARSSLRYAGSGNPALA